jgi:hypothetical protein
VASHPDYRRRGLVRALFQAFHACSADAGEPVQAITGIPYYYRQFGYEFAVDLGGSRIVMFDDIPPLKEGAPEPYRLAAATPEDLPFAMALYEQERRRSAVSTEVPAAYWRWVLDGVSPASGEGWKTFVIVDQTDAQRGMVLVSPRRWENTLGVRTLAVREDASYLEVIRPLLRALRDLAPTIPAAREDKVPNRIEFDLGVHHPVYDVLGEALAPRYDPPYAWYVRVADLPGFLRHIAPALERRLADSALAGHSGELRVDFYRSGLRLVLEQGHITTVEDWRPPIRPAAGDEAMAGFPPLVFLQLLFGRRSLHDLRYAFPDVWAGDEGQPLLEALFPPRPSHVVELS